MLRGKKNQNQDSRNSDSWLLSLHHRSQNCRHKENSSDLRTDDNLWVQDLENMWDNAV